ncbi:UMP-CMP kinase [Auricularia subglabra TFB-10046 SS5]|nr:UMP-CMP kinase [Auricularia subglabra TFB-10046 SS5]
MTVFDDRIVVIYVLGGPGAGKGTQCARLVEEFDFVHLSAGDLLRAEQHREGSEFSKLIQDCIKNGTIVPMEVTIKLLENAMKEAVERKSGSHGWEDGRGRFLVDGFPRKMDQALKFDEDVRPASAVLFFTTSEEVMLKRLLKRGETSGREDDNEESIKKRFVTYMEATMPVIDYYRSLNKVAEIDSTGSVDEVHAKAATVVNAIFKSEMTANIVLA